MTSKSGCVKTLDRKAIRDWFVDEFWKKEKPNVAWDVFMAGFSYARVQRLFFNINWSEVNNM
jgi:hypothetical protein